MACEISRQTSLAEHLCGIPDDPPYDEAKAFVSEWRTMLISQLHDMGSNFTALADDMPLTFPHQGTVATYVHPRTSWSQGGHGPDASNWNLKQPALAALAAYGERYHGWGTMGHLLPQFCLEVWPGICICKLIKVHSHSLSPNSLGDANAPVTPAL